MKRYQRPSPTFIVAGVIVGLSLFVILSMLFYGPTDYVENSQRLSQEEGLRFGIASLFFGSFGVGAYIGWAIILTWAVIVFFKESVGDMVLRGVSLGVVVVSGAALAEILGSGGLGGDLGFAIGSVLEANLGTALGVILVGTIFGFSLVLATDYGFLTYYKEAKGALAVADDPESESSADTDLIALIDRTASEVDVEEDAGEILVEEPVGEPEPEAETIPIAVDPKPPIEEEDLGDELLVEEKAAEEEPAAEVAERFPGGLRIEEDPSTLLDDLAIPEPGEEAGEPVASESAVGESAVGESEIAGEYPEAGSSEAEEVALDVTDEVDLNEVIAVPETAEEEATAFGTESDDLPVATQPFIETEPDLSELEEPPVEAAPEEPVESEAEGPARGTNGWDHSRRLASVLDTLLGPDDSDELAIETSPGREGAEAEVEPIEEEAPEEVAAEAPTVVLEDEIILIDEMVEIPQETGAVVFEEGEEEEEDDYEEEEEVDDGAITKEFPSLGEELAEIEVIDQSEELQEVEELPEPIVVIDDEILTREEPEPVEVLEEEPRRDSMLPFMEEGAGEEKKGVLRSIFGRKKQNREKPKADPLLEEAARLALERGRASVVLLQRRLDIGHTRAFRLVEALESEGLVGPLLESGSREVLMSLDEWEARRAESEE